MCVCGGGVRARECACVCERDSMYVSIERERAGMFVSVCMYTHMWPFVQVRFLGHSLSLT